jgi:hypothetical protein
VVGSLTISEYQELEGSKLELPNVKDKFANDFDVASDFVNNSSKKINQTVANIEENEYTPIEIVLSTMLTDTWQPQRWQNSK